MLQSLLKTLVADGVAEFAVAPVPISDDLPHFARERSSATGRRRTCPHGLKRAEVLSTNHQWMETVTLGCGTPNESKHQVTHKNGVLVRIPYEDDLKRVSQSSHATVQALASHNGQRFLYLTVSHKALIMPWSEYEPVVTQREELSRAAKERQAELDEVADRLGVQPNVFFTSRTELHERDLKREDGKRRQRLLDDADWVADRPRYYNDDGLVPHAIGGAIIVPLDRARELADILDEWEPKR